MGKTNNDSFLSSLDKMLKDTKESGSVTITLKRCKILAFFQAKSNHQKQSNPKMEDINPEQSKVEN